VTRLLATLLATVAASSLSATAACPTHATPVTPCDRSAGALARVAHAAAQAPPPEEPAPLDDGPLLATLVQTHTDERLLLDARAPDMPRFTALLSDRTSGTSHAIDPRLLDLLRALAARHGAPAMPPRIEIVSGYRSPKLNELLRKKGHHVASHSQHSQGHAVDFRIVDFRTKDGAEKDKALDPRAVEKEIRALGWQGGVGVYPTKDDWFVHADVGENRRWVN
jgi:uncharacterized protein YcbK (DUF882 family)